jgi:hypothetical protein
MDQHRSCESIENNNNISRINQLVFHGDTQLRDVQCTKRDHTNTIREKTSLSGKLTFGFLFLVFDYSNFTLRCCKK